MYKARFAGWRSQSKPIWPPMNQNGYQTPSYWTNAQLFFMLDLTAWHLPFHGVFISCLRILKSRHGSGKNSSAVRSRTFRKSWLPKSWRIIGEWLTSFHTWMPSCEKPCDCALQCTAQFALQLKTIVYRYLNPLHCKMAQLSRKADTSLFAKEAMCIYLSKALIIHQISGAKRLRNLSKSLAWCVNPLNVNMLVPTGGHLFPKMRKHLYIQA